MMRDQVLMLVQIVVKKSNDDISACYGRSDRLSLQFSTDLNFWLTVLFWFDKNKETKKKKKSNEVFFFNC